jgi:hypothetical protein
MNLKVQRQSEIIELLSGEISEGTIREVDRIKVAINADIDKSDAAIR